MVRIIGSVYGATALLFLLSHPAWADLEIESTGSGFVISKGGHVLTNHHVIKDCQQVRVTLPSGSGEAAIVMGTDQRNDLALLKLPTYQPKVASFREGRGVRQGDSVVALGFPLRGLLGSGANLTTGTISALAGPGDDTRYLQITAPIQPGNSGGPLLDQSGNVVGVIVAKLDAIRVARATGDIPQNVNFAINAALARPFLDSNGVEYVLAPSNVTLQAADIGDRAKQFTAVVECWRDRATPSTARNDPVSPSDKEPRITLPGIWTSLTTGNQFSVRLDEPYLQWVQLSNVVNLQWVAGQGEAKRSGASFIGPGRVTLRNGLTLRTCTFTVQWTFSVVTPRRIEGEIVGPAGSLDWSSCRFTGGEERSHFVWVPQ